MSLDPACHAECLEFIRVAIAEASSTTAHEITAVLKEVCTEGQADRAAIWSDLTETEQQQFQELLAPPVIARDASPQNPRSARLQFPRRGCGHRERVERGDRHGPAYSSRCFGGCWRNRIYPVQADCRMNQAIGLREAATKKIS